MKTLMVASPFLLLVAGLRAQEYIEPVTHCCKEGREARAWIGAGKGVKWEDSLERARRRAAEEGKPVLLFQLVGDLDKEGC
jgi:hypothetical protein